MSWFVSRNKRRNASMRLYCFAHAGGSVDEFLPWGDLLADIEVIGVQLPGRGTRLEEPPFRRMVTLVKSLVRCVAFREPFAFFGHGLGALIAFETARALRNAGREQPEALFASASPAPDSRVRRVALMPPVREDLEIVESYAYVPGKLLDMPLIAIGGADDEIAGEDLASWYRQTEGPFALHLLPGDHFYFREQRDALLRIVAAARASLLAFEATRT